MTLRCLFLLGLCLVLVGARPLAAQDTSEADTSSTTLKEALRQNRHPLRLVDGELEGSGGEWLRERAMEATIVTLGESHATQEIPAVMAALIEDLQQAGTFDYLAVETSPWTTQLMTDRLREGKDAYDAFIEQYPAAIPFYNLEIERDLVHQVVQHSEHDRPLWGLDQIFVFSTSLAFDRLEELAPSETARAAVQEVRSAGQAKSTDDPRLQKLPPGMPAPLPVYAPAAFDTLRSRFEGIEEAQRILTELSTSTKIYQLNDTDNYVSNQIRARYLRDNLRRHVRRAREASDETPRVVIKVGAAHAYRGLTPNNALDVGNLSVALAREMGGEALNVAGALKDFPLERAREILNPINGRVAETVGPDVDYVVVEDRSVAEAEQNRKAGPDTLSAREFGDLIQLNSTLWIGFPDHHIGADLVGEWYKRNLRIYANVWRAAEPESDRVIVMLGQGHIWTLRQFFRENPDFEVVPVSEVL